MQCRKPSNLFPTISFVFKIKKLFKSFNLLGDIIKGVVVINANSDIKHDGLVLTAEGHVAMQVSQKNTGVFEAFYNSVNKPITVFSHSIELLVPGKISIGITEVEFEFLLEGKKGSESELYEAYSGVFISVNYFIKCDLKRKFLAKDSQAKTQFFVQNKVGWILC